MKPKELLRILKKSGCIEVRQRGSHIVIECGSCKTIVAMHLTDIPKGTWSQIKKDLAPCLGERWWEK